MFFFLPNYFKISKNIDNVTKNVFVIYFILVFSLCEIRVLQDRASSLFCIGLIMLFVQYYADLKCRLHKQLYILCVIGIMFITGFKYFSVESYRYRTSFTADADYNRYDEELEKRKLEEYLDAVKRNEGVKKEKNDQLKDFDRIRAEQGIEKVKDQKLHRQQPVKTKKKKKKDLEDELEDYEEGINKDKELEESNKTENESIEDKDKKRDDSIEKDSRRRTRHKESSSSNRQRQNRR